MQNITSIDIGLIDKTIIEDIVENIPDIIENIIPSIISGHKILFMIFYI